MLLSCSQTNTIKRPVLVLRPRSCVQRTQLRCPQIAQYAAFDGAADWAKTQVREMKRAQGLKRPPADRRTHYISRQPPEIPASRLSLSLWTGDRYATSVEGTL